MDSQKLKQLASCNINYYKLKQKAVISSGKLQILANGTHLILKSPQKTLEIPHKTTIARLRQMSYVTYLYTCENGGVFTFSLPAIDATIPDTQKIIQNYIQIADYYMLNTDMELKQKISYDCPLGQPGSPQLGMTNDDKLKQVGEGIGVVFGGISSLFDMSKMSKASDEAITKFSRESFSEQTLSKWQLFKNKCSSFNDKITQALKPINQKCKEFADDVGKKFESSDNSFIKGVKQYSKKTEKAINQGYQKGDPRSKSQNVESNQNQTKSQIANPMKQENLKLSSNQRKSLL